MNQELGDGSQDDKNNIEDVDITNQNEEEWNFALNFLKIQNEKTVKQKENWKKEKKTLNFKVQRMKLQLQKYKKENEVLANRLRSIKLKKMYKDKLKLHHKNKSDKEKDQTVFKTVKKDPEKIISLKKMISWNSNAIAGIRNSHTIQPSSARNVRGVGILHQNNLKAGYATSRKSDNIVKLDLKKLYKDRRRHIRAKSDIPILTHLVKSKGGEGMSMGGIMSRRFEKMGNKGNGSNTLRYSGDTPISSRTAGLLRLSLDKDNRRERLASSIAGSALFGNIKVLNEQAKKEGGNKRFAEKLKNDMSKTHRRNWNVKYAKLSKIEKNVKSPGLSEIKKKKNIRSRLNSEKTTREESFMNHNHSSLKKFKLNFSSNESRKQLRISEEYDLDFRASSQRNLIKTARLNYEKSVTDLMPSTIKLGEKVVKVNKVLNHHLDSVRDVSFFDPDLMLSSSDDFTVCLWDLGLDSRSSRKKGISPVFVSRVDSHPILKLEKNQSQSSDGNSIFSSNINGEIRLWSLYKYRNSSNKEISTLLPSDILATRSDAIWDMATTPLNHLLLTSSSEGVGVWDINECNIIKDKDYKLRGFGSNLRSPVVEILNQELEFFSKSEVSSICEGCVVKKLECIQEFKYDPNSLFFIKKSSKGKYGRVSSFIDRKKSYDIPTSLTWVDKSIFASGFSNSNHVVLFDIEKSKKLLSMKLNRMSKLKSFGSRNGYLSQPNKIILENENMLFVGYEDKKVACFDRRTGKTVKEFIAHTDSVTSLQFSKKSSILFTSSHDGSLRSWDIRTFRCVNDMNIHRKKFDESIMSLKMNTDKSKLASAGADGYVKIMNLVK